MTKPHISQFTALCMAQRGDKYIFAAETSPTDPNPEAFDCSELVEWASRHLQVEMVDGSMNQRAFCQARRTMISPAKARATRGALLFRDVSVTGIGHVAVSLGNGFTIEARGSAYGVGKFSFDNRGWTEAALHPGFSYRHKTSKPQMAEFWVAFGRYGGRYGRSEALPDPKVTKAVKEAEAKHGAAVLIHREEPVSLDDLDAASYPKWLARKHQRAA